MKSFKKNWDRISSSVGKTRKEIIETYNKAVLEIDESYQLVLQDIQKYYDRMDKLAILAYDVTASADSQLKSSIDYARAAGVPEDKILHNLKEIDDYFLS